MLCAGCGASYDSSFKFCPHCGRSRPEPITIQVEVPEVKWEVCQIQMFYDKIDGQWCGGWKAVQVTPQGPRAIRVEQYVSPQQKTWREAWESSYRKSQRADAKTELDKKAYDALLAHMVGLGWEVAHMSFGHVVMMKRLIR